jgi:hypothetical protein
MPQNPVIENALVSSVSQERLLDYGMKLGPRPAAKGAPSALSVETGVAQEIRNGNQRSSDQLVLLLKLCQILAPNGKWLFFGNVSAWAILLVILRDVHLML